MKKLLLLALFLLMQACYSVQFVYHGFTQLQVEEACKSSVDVNVYFVDGRSSGGSGTVIGDRQVLTAYHVVNHIFPVANITIVKNGVVLASGVVIKEGNPLSDWAIIKTSADLKLPVIEITHRIPERGESVLAVGYPLGATDVWATDGRYQYATSEHRFKFTSPITNGNSGGGVFVMEDGKLRLFGIAVERALNPQFDWGEVHHLGGGVFATEALK